MTWRGLLCMSIFFQFSQAIVAILGAVNYFIVSNACDRNDRTYVRPDGGAAAYYDKDSFDFSLDDLVGFFIWMALFSSFTFAIFIYGFIVDSIEDCFLFEWAFCLFNIILGFCFFQPLTTGTISTYYCKNSSFGNMMYYDEFMWIFFGISGLQIANLIVIVNIRDYQCFQESLEKNEVPEIVVSSNEPHRNS